MDTTASLAAPLEPSPDAWPTGWRDLARAVWVGHRGLAVLTLGALGLLVACLGLQLVDGHQVLGAPAWMKPAKFAASIALAAPTLAWILGQMRRDRRWWRLDRAGRVVAVVAALELLGITVQAARGVPSHFNNATAIDRAVFAAMGLAISLLWVAELYVTVRAFRVRFVTPLRTWAVRLGLVGTLLGGAVGALMPRPTAAQLESLRAGRGAPQLGAHAIGVPDGGPGLPFTRWSTEGGDLRVPHFFGLHALQALPVAAWLLERRRHRQRPRTSSSPASARPIVALGVAWLGVTAVTLWQALRAQPLLAPDAPTLLGLAVVVVAAAAIAIAGGEGLSHRPPASARLSS